MANSILTITAFAVTEGGNWITPDTTVGTIKVCYPAELVQHEIATMLKIATVAAIKTGEGPIYDFLLGKWREPVSWPEQVPSPGRLMQAQDTYKAEATKLDTGKLRYSLLPSYATEEVVKVLEFGAKKYAAHNWQKGMEWTRMYDAARRHMEAWQRGENTDPESGIPHTAHAICCLMFLLEYQRFGVGTDDRNQLAGNPFVKA